MDNKEFFRQAGKIHDMHIRNEESADVEIAKKRIDKYFKGELNLSWKTIIYEINKLPELERNTAIKKLVDEEVNKERNLIKKQYEEIIAKQTLFNFIKSKLKGHENDK